MKRFVLAGIPFVAAGLCAAVLLTVRAGAAPDQASGSQLSRRDMLVNAARQINTAEYAYNHESNHFAEWKSLAESAALQTAQAHSKMRDGHAIALAPSSEVLPQVNLRLLVSPDGNHYQFAMTDTQDSKCSFTVFSDEDGVIYQGLAIGCPIN